MISLNKIFFWLISSIIFVWLIFYTFLNENHNTFDKVFYKNNEKWIYWLNIENNQLYFNTWSTNDTLEINYLNQFDKVLSYSWKVVLNNNEISLNKWVFLINISEINSNYIVSWEWFNIKINWPSTIYIDNSWIRTSIFSLNSYIWLDLINIENSQVINNVYLYPHNYIKFIPSQNKNVENADLLRLTQRFPLEYFNERLFIDWKINNNIFSKIIWNKSEQDYKNIEKLFLFLYINNKNEEKYLKDFKTNKFWTLIWEKFIKQYNDLFLNEAKKTIYYKNLILRTIWDIVKSDKIDNSKNQFLIDSLNELKQISENDYNEMKSILDFYSNMVIDWWKNDINSKINFSKIYNKIENKPYIFKNDYLLLLNNLYFNYDFKDYSNIYKDLNSINQEIIKNKLDENKKSYFIFFLKKTILSWFDDLSKNKDIVLEDILNIFNDYISTSISYYSIDDNVRIRTWIEDYNEILKKLASKIETNYFEKEKDNQWLLVLNKKNSISLEKIKILEDNINSIFNYFEKNKEVLWTRTKDELIKNEFENRKKLYDQYILAIKDYNSYIANYNEQNKELLFWETINQEDNWNREISIENAKKFLSFFNYLETSSVKISIRWYNYCDNPIEKYDNEDYDEPYCYKIEDLIIWSNLRLNFLLSPNDYNNITNFVINWDKNINKWSYKLDNEKIIWDESLKKNSWESDIDKYKFENFFLYVFNPPNDWNNTKPIIIDNNNEIEESLIVKIFKRNKLLWENWDFKSLNWFIDIDYEDLIVKDLNWDYDINLVNARLSYSNENIKYNWDFSSKYIFLPDHSFVNPEIIFYDDLWNQLFWWKKIKVIWKFNVNKIKSDLWFFFENVASIYTILINLSSHTRSDKNEITFDNDKKLFYIKNWDISITNIWISIKSITYKWKEILSKQISIYDLEENLKLIK